MIQEVSKFNFKPTELKDSARAPKKLETSNANSPNSELLKTQKKSDIKSNANDSFRSQLKEKSNDIQDKKNIAQDKNEQKKVNAFNDDSPRAVTKDNIRSRDKVSIRDEQKKPDDKYEIESKSTDSNNGKGIQPPVINSQKVALEQPKQINQTNEPAVFDISEMQGQVEEVKSENSPVIKFMKFMKDNYNVQPEDIVEAMNNLSDEELLATPQDSMYAFFNNLGLQGANLAPAKEQYLSMLSEMNAVEDQKSQKQNVAVEVLDPKKQKMLETNRKLEQMNASFFVNSPVKQTQSVSIVQTDVSQDKLSPDKFFVNGKAEQLKNINQQEVNKNFAANNVYKPADVNAGLNLQATALEDSSDISESSTAAALAKEILPQTKAETAAPINELMAKLNTQIQNLEKSLGNDGEKDSDNKQSLDEGMNFLSTTQDKQVDTKLGAASFANELKSAGKDSSEAENIKSIINQAQIMIKKGGGEMKVQMQPEGLGNVNLKVKVEDGKVGIQMLADTADAKRLLDGSLADLKAHLSQHKLSVDSFKVDVSDKFNENLNQQSDLNREEARGFLNQFREQNEQMRNPFQNDSPGMRVYRNYGGKDVQNKPQESQNVAARKSESGRLHLVA